MKHITAASSNNIQTHIPGPRRCAVCGRVCRDRIIPRCSIPEVCSRHVPAGAKIPPPLVQQRVDISSVLGTQRSTLGAIFGFFGFSCMCVYMGSRWYILALNIDTAVSSSNRALQHRWRIFIVCDTLPTSCVLAFCQPLPPLWYIKEKEQACLHSCFRTRFQSVGLSVAVVSGLRSSLQAVSAVAHGRCDTWHKNVCESEKNILSEYTYRRPLQR